MKKQIILASIVALLEIGHAQVWTTGFSPGQETTPGRVGVGTNLPAFKLDVLTADTDGGLRIRQTNGAVKGGAHLYLDNNDGHNWSLISTGGPNNIGKNHFVIYDLSHSPIKPRFFISGTGGNVGIGTTVTDYDTKLNVENNTSATLPQWGAKINVLQTTAIPPAGAHNDRIALEANASTNYIHEAIMYGVIGNSSYGLYNTGGKFKAFNVYGFNNGKCIGVDATAIGSQNAYGVYATATSGASTNWAGYFVGNVYSTGSFIASDKKLKREINPVSNMMERIMKLKPSTYNYKTEEFKEMQLPEGNQIGLIAQELEEVFPELTSKVAEFKKVDKEGKEIIVNPEFTSVNYVGLVPILLAGIQEQQKSINLQTQINADLQKQLDEQKQLIAELSQKSGNATGINNLNSVETGFTMSQNEPNPFTHETVVKYTLPQTINSAFMAVYDLTGKQITTFPIRDKGTSSITITSQNLAAGIYIYSIVADGKVVVSKRMIVADK